MVRKVDHYVSLVDRSRPNDDVLDFYSLLPVDDLNVKFCSIRIFDLEVERQFSPGSLLEFQVQ